MRNLVKFVCPREILFAEEDESVFGTQRASWFAEFLAKVPGLEIDSSFVQEDWGVMIFVLREGRLFWVGLSPSWDAEHSWLAHVNHTSLHQRFTPSGCRAMAALIEDIDRVLRAEPDVSNARWMDERDA
jgi:hypothetical protein